MAILTIYAALLAVVNFPIVILVEWRARRPVKPVFALHSSARQRAREIRNALLTTPVHALLFLFALGSGLVSTAPETIGLVASTFLAAFLWTEFWHYASHVAFHWKPLHFIHREHHRSHLTGPWSALSFSLIEKLIFSAGILGGLALASRLRPLSALGIFSYYLVYFATNVLGHSNVEFRRPGYYHRIFGRIFNSPTYHALHHARYVRNYGLLTPWLDRLFGTGWPDVAEVQTRAAEGRPLTRLAERCAAADPCLHIGDL